MNNNPLLKLEAFGQSIWIGYLDAATQKLEEEGVQKFTQAFDGLMKALKEKQSKRPAKATI